MSTSSPPSAFDDLLGVLGVASPLAGAATPTPANVAMVVGPDPLTIGAGTLGSQSFSGYGPPGRLTYILGQGATLRGVASVIAPACTSVSADAITRALLTYNNPRLDLSSATTSIVVGTAVLCPVEHTGDTTWVTSADTLRTLAAACDPAWLPAADYVAEPLGVPTADTLADQYTAYSTNWPDNSKLAADLVARLLLNAYDACPLAVRALGDLTRNADIALGLSDLLVAAGGDGAGALLAETTGGNVFLRRLWLLLSSMSGLTGSAATSQVNGQAFAGAALGLVGASQGAIGSDPRDYGPSVTPIEPPMSAANMSDRGGQDASADGDVEPFGGYHRLVLGRELVSGYDTLYPKHPAAGATTYHGPAYVGRLALAPILAKRGAQIAPPNSLLAARLAVAKVVMVNEGRLDAARIADAGIVSVGIQQWTSRYELARLMVDWYQQAPDEFDMFLGVYGIEVDLGNGELQHISGPGAEPADMPFSLAPEGEVMVFGGVQTPGHYEYIPGSLNWAARFRLAGLLAPTWQNIQITHAANRFDQIRSMTATWTIGGTGYHLADLFTSQYGAALLLDQHINSPNLIVDDVTNAISDAKIVGSLTAAAILKIVQCYAVDRTFANDPDGSVADGRRARIDKAELDATPGSFTGWS